MIQLTWQMVIGYVIVSLVMLFIGFCVGGLSGQVAAAEKYAKGYREATQDVLEKLVKPVIEGKIQ